MRIAVLLAGLLVAVPAWAGEEVAPPAVPAPEVEKESTPALAPKAIDVGGVVTALARGREGEEILLALEDGTILRQGIGRGATWRGTTGGAAADVLAAAPAGKAFAAATPTELLVFGAKPGAALWRTARPVAFAFDAEGRRLVTLTSKGEVVELDAATGGDLARRKFEEGRSVLKASLHVPAGLAVLGVADG